jgi:hypothetical protein
VRRFFTALLTVAFLMAPSLPAPIQAQDVPVKTARPLTDKQIKKRLIQDSIDDYPGNCPSPYNRASNGSRCGKRSAYSKPGGYAPLCFDRDITQAMIDAYRKRTP